MTRTPMRQLSQPPTRTLAQLSMRRRSTPRHPRCCRGVLARTESVGAAPARAANRCALPVEAAAPADTSGATVAEPEYAPKGSTSPTDDSKVQPADVPPLPAATPSVPVTPPPTRAPSGKSGVNFTYSGGFQAAETDGIYANVTIAKPKLDKSDFHTLGEIALESADDPDNPDVRQIVEVGWNVDRSVNNDDDPHLFVYHWVNGQSTCYNGCGFVQFSSSVKPGDTLSYGVTKKIGVQYAGGAWWIAFDSEWVGYFPEKLWNDAGVKFSRSGLLQVFGEVASPDQPSCATQMGTGVTPVADTDNAAKMASVSYLNGPAVVLAPVVNLQARFPMVALSARTIAYGGGTPPLASAKVGSAQLTVC